MGNSQFKTMKRGGITYRALIMKAAMVAVMMFTLCGCRTKYVSVPEYHTEWRTKTDTVIKADSVTVRDSVTMWMKGDTVFKEKISYRDRLRYIYKAKTDTVTVRDSVSVAVPVERKASLYEKAKSKLFLPLCVAVCLMGILMWIKNRSVLF